ncbi:SDR family oxidoreductase [Dehalococcoidia bacterium]|nr:SDR family oxidoreductase [Dehalococcoidia bacterium]
MMNGKVAIVTGGAGGIGSAVCRAFIAEGVAVGIADMDALGLNELAMHIESNGGDALAVEVDVSFEESVNFATQQVVDRFGRLDFLVHCAGNNIQSPILDLTVEDWTSVLNSHLTGAFLFSKSVGRHLVEQGEGGRVVFMSSVAARAPVPERGAYTPSKAGLIGLAAVLSLEWAPHNINVNSICPGVVLTPMTDLVYTRQPELRKQRLKRVPAGREAYPEEIADLTIFLCSDKAVHINGAAIPVDGAFLNNGFMVERG